MPETAPWRWTAAIGAGFALRVGYRALILDQDDHWRANTARLQVAQLRRNLTAARATEFGKAHDFARLIRLGDRELVNAYRRAVPIGDWYDFAEPIGRMREGGQRDVLWPGLVRDFAQTSGTTSGDKYLPVSKQLLRSNFLASMDIFAHLTRFGLSLPWLLSGKCLFMGGSTTLSANEHGVRTGDLSGLVAPMIRWPLTTVYAPGRAIALMDDWPAKIDAMARSCLDLDMRMISGMPSWAHVLFERLIELANERGRKASCVHDVWPNLVLFIHGGVRYEPFEPRINEVVFGDAATDFPVRIELYPASEGFVAIQDRKGEPGLRIIPDIGIYYEFVPLESIDDDDPPALSVWEVEPGVRYVVVMSSCGGLWRYVLGDTVVFEDVPGDLDGAGGTGPPRLRIVGRHRHFINAFGENLIVEHIERAVAVASAATGVRIGEFTAAPIYPTADNPAGLEVAVECQSRPTADQREVFVRALDADLKEQNVDYATKRSDNLGMGSPTLTVLAMGTFHQWMASRGKLGGQHKCPRCANTRETIEEIRGVAQGNEARTRARPQARAGTLQSSPLPAR